MFLFGALVALGSIGGELPTRMDIDFARVDRIHRCFGGDGMVHCNRVRNVRCFFVNGDRALARCNYEEWAPARRWSRKTIVMRRAGEDWQWVSGNAPRCSITVLAEE